MDSGRSAGPRGAERRNLLTYTIEYENEGAGTAHGCYVVAHLGPLLAENILLLLERMLYDPKTRNLLRKIGTLALWFRMQVSYTVQVEDHASRA